MSRSRTRVLAIVAGSILTLTALPAAALAQDGEDPSWKPDPACQSDDPVVQDAIENTIARTGVQDQWYGPESGPAPIPGTKVVWIPTDPANQLSITWGEEIAKVGAQIGWEVQILNPSSGSTSDHIDAMTQAIALQPDVIMYSMDARPLAEQNKEAIAQGITVIGLHGLALPGPDEDAGLFSNITSHPVEIGQAMADYMIANTCGTARGIVQYDSVYEIATFKGQAMNDRLSECRDCTVLEFIDDPLSELSTLEPQRCANWAVEYGTGWQAMTVYDGVWDFCTPALEDAGVGPTDVKLIASDGTGPGYERIRNGQYQVATVPEPAELQAYMAIDDAIRAAAGEAPAGWDQPVFIHFNDGIHGNNLAIEGGDRGQFFPSNDYKARYLELWGVDS